MFTSIGRFVDRYRWFFLAAWVAVAVAITLVAPNLEDIASNDTSSFLPSDAPAITGQALVDEYFPGSFQDSTITLVFDAGEGAQITTPENSAYIAEISNWLVSDTAPVGIGGVQSPSLNPEAASALISPDEQVALAVIQLDVTDTLEFEALLTDLDARFAENSNGVTVYKTGQEAIFHDYDLAITETVDRTLIVTVALVVIILLVIYRSPISPFIPLGVVTIAYMTARGIVALLGDAGVFEVSGTASMLLIVVMYGSGTDYCLFLINRFREELAERDDVNGGVRNTIKYVGESITSSAGTTITGFVAMASAQLGLFNTAGPTLAIGIAVSLLAGLTLTPALLSLLGQRAFWPGKATVRETGAWYKRTSQMVSTRPLMTICLIVLVMAPFAIYGTGQESTYDTLADLPEDTASVVGFRLLEEHLGAGNLQPTTVVTELSGADAQVEVAALSAELEDLPGVASVRSATQPLGVPLSEMQADPNLSAEQAAAMQAQISVLAESYINPAGAARFEVVLVDNPYSLEAMDTIAEIRTVLIAQPGNDAIVGATAINADVRDTLQEDIRNTIALVLVGIFIVLTLMLRSLVAPSYLIGTILLSYGTTLGVTRIASEVLWDADQMVWWVPFFIFVFLVALGIDYSIFLFGRIKEEVRTHGIHDGIHSAVQATGSIITSAGIIVAGTFGALMGGEILGLAQVGFGVAIGILIDTFVVRTILDPALATLFGRWTWWPGNVTVDQPAHDPRRTTGEMAPVPGSGD